MYMKQIRTLIYNNTNTDKNIYIFYSILSQKTYSRYWLHLYIDAFFSQYATYLTYCRNNIFVFIVIKIYCSRCWIMYYSFYQTWYNIDIILLEGCLILSLSDLDAMLDPISLWCTLSLSLSNLCLSYSTQ